MMRIAAMAVTSTAILCNGLLLRAEEPATAKKVAPDVKLSQRASEIIGLNIKNAAGKQLGTVNDIVLDVNKGSIRYFAVSYGGFLGLGDKLFAIWREKIDTYYIIEKVEVKRTSASR